MTTVFIGGSRRISRLNRSITARLDRIIESGFTVLIGDANGADKSVQDYLSSKRYPNVLVFCMEDKCRNNVGNWPTNSTRTTSDKRDFSFYVAKDLKMVKEADYGFMIWDAKSKGTLNNIFNLIKENKKTLVYFSPERSCYPLATPEDLQRLLSKCDRQYLEIFENDFKISEMLAKRANEMPKSLRKYAKPIQPTLWADHESSPGYMREPRTSHRPAIEVQKSEQNEYHGALSDRAKP